MTRVRAARESLCQMKMNRNEREREASLLSPRAKDAISRSLLIRKCTLGHANAYGNFANFHQQKRKRKEKQIHVFFSPQPFFPSFLLFRTYATLSFISTAKCTIAFVTRNDLSEFLYIPNSSTVSFVIVEIYAKEFR